MKHNQPTNHLSLDAAIFKHTDDTYIYIGR